MLEPGEGKPSRRVLRGEGHREVPALPDDMVCFGARRDVLKSHRAAIEAWLREHRRLSLNPRKAHILPARVSRSWLGYRLSPAGYDLGPKAVKRFRKKLSGLVMGSPGRLRRALEAWRGMMLF